MCGTSWPAREARDAQLHRPAEISAEKNSLSIDGSPARSLLLWTCTSGHVASNSATYSAFSFDSCAAAQETTSKFKMHTIGSAAANRFIFRDSLRPVFAHFEIPVRVAGKIGPGTGRDTTKMPFAAIISVGDQNRVRVVGAVPVR